MKKNLFILFLLLFSTAFLFSEDEPKEKKLEYSGDRFGLGIMIGMDSPVLVGNDKGFAVTDKFGGDGAVALSIEDFIFGIPLQFDWMWTDKNGSGIGIKLDLDTMYVPITDYQSIFDSLSGEVENLLGSFGGGGDTIDSTEQTENLEHGIRAQLSPMFSGKISFVKISFGPSLLLDMNVNHLHEANLVQKGGEIEAGKDLAYILKKSGLDAGKTYDSLTGLEKIAYWGMEIDFALRAGLDFELGKNLVLGAAFDLRFNSDITKWDSSLEGPDAVSENFAAVFDPSKFEGVLGVRLLWMF